MENDFISIKKIFWTLSDISISINERAAAPFLPLIILQFTINNKIISTNLKVFFAKNFAFIYSKLGNQFKNMNK